MSLYTTKSWFSIDICYRLRSATLVKKRLWHRSFPVDFAKFLRTPFLQCSVYTHFDSFLPNTYKIGMIYTLIDALGYAL